MPSMHIVFEYINTTLMVIDINDVMSENSVYTFSNAHIFVIDKDNFIKFQERFIKASSFLETP